MKLILAVIKPQRLDAVKDALRELGVDGMTSIEAQGFGRAGSATEIYRGAQLRLDFVPMVQVEVVSSDEDVDEAVAAIVKAARTGKAGDGHVVVVPLDQVHRIRTGESGPRMV
jgi:nitrogen regulatory protein P-II 1